ncbi:hypothetical protein DES45_106371 [Microvirga subterranea]|uniref:Uncharacterized protein n=2 Tax=Microvirga subterranea TaxID=186651 RepID=A0A370HIP1_9HYPH|nr:hypothetical protein DES45_106371 [Microvirga subterranea]
MEPQAYSAFADLLNKFHTSSEAIQALWLLLVPATILGIAWLVLRTLRDIAALRTPPPEAPKSLLVYGVAQDEDGRWLVIRHGAEPIPLDRSNPPRELAELD